MIPSVGRIVHYRLASHDLPAINARIPGQSGNPHAEGDVVPMLICRVWAPEPTESTVVNGQAFVDGNYSLWVTSRLQGDQPGQWADPRS